jgi:hypothetical protein
MTDDDSPGVYRGGRKPGQKNKHSIATMSRTVVDAIYTSLFIDGNPTAYFRDLKKKQPVLYAGMVRDLMMMSAKNSGDTGGLVVNVVTLNSPAVPTPGVLCSPIAEHIAPQRHLTLVHDMTDVVDNEATGNE